MITGITNWYSIFTSDYEGDRLDFVFHHPSLDGIRLHRKGNVSPLSNVITEPEYGVSESGLQEGQFGFLNVQHIMANGEINFEPPAFIESCNEDSLLRENDILIARTGHTLGKTALIGSEYAGYAFGSFCIRFALRPDIDFETEFIVRFLNSSMGQQQIFMLKSGSGKYNINTDQIKDIRIPQIDRSRQVQAMLEAR